MCGIAGVYTPRPIGPFRSHVERIVESQHRRGPDFRAVETIVGHRSCAVFGHNRLSIIDLSPAGNQPMWDIDRRLCVVFNGEIYNYVELRAELLALGHRFISNSDTEVILESFKRWGPDAFPRFNGMFAMALFDTRNERLYLARDRFGVKPLYYVLRDDTIHFASTCGEIARLLSLSPSLEYLAGGVHYGLYEHADTAPFVGMKALLPGHWLQIDPVGLGNQISSLKSYYDLHANVEALAESLATVSIEQAVDRLAALLDDAVRIRLRSDVPVAVSLSGGLDSSTVAALAVRHPMEKLRGFTFGDPRVRTSEGPLTAQLAEMADIEVTYVWPSISEICQSYEETLSAQVSPLADASAIAQYMVFRSARAAGFKVLLGGQGADETYMGYRKFQWFHFWQLKAQGRYVEALGFALTLLPTLFAERGRWVDSWNSRNRYLKRSGLMTVLRLPDSEMDIGNAPLQSLRKRQILDVSSASLPTLLRYEDSNSMGSSIESRLPFLDYRVMEFGIALPEALKLRGGHGKWIIRRAMAGKIPEAIRVGRMKKGFNVDYNHWIDGGLGDHIRTMLHERFDQVSNWLAPGASLDDVFSSEQLKLRPAAFVEATTLIWLANATRHSLAVLDS